MIAGIEELEERMKRRRRRKRKEEEREEYCGEKVTGNMTLTRVDCFSTNFCRRTLLPLADDSIKGINPADNYI